ncbi:MAG TPA: hypothetical protein VF929_10300 [Gemmatimonadaceae bacterium]
MTPQIYGSSRDGSIREVTMDLGILGAIALLVVWAIAALVVEGPGWVHLLLTVGVSLLIYRIVARGSSRPER